MHVIRRWRQRLLWRLMVNNGRFCNDKMRDCEVMNDDDEMK
jgi:hypothetical protein